MVQLLPMKAELTGERPDFIQTEQLLWKLPPVLLYTQRNNNLCSFAAWPINPQQAALVKLGFCEL